MADVSGGHGQRGAGLRRRGPEAEEERIMKNGYYGYTALRAADTLYEV